MSDADTRPLLSKWDELPLRERQELASALRMGIASPFWREYRAWLGDLLQDAIRSLVPPCTDISSILSSENKKGRLAALDQAMSSPEVLLEQIAASIAAETAKEQSDDRADQPFNPFPDGAPRA